MGLGVAIRAFTAGLFNRQVAQQLQAVLDGGPGESVDRALPPPQSDSKKDAEPATPVRRTPSRSDAITLLSALQREARLVDLIQEDLSAYSDAQIGAAARPCLLQCRSSLQRMLSIRSVSDAAEGATVEIGADASSARFQWIGEGGADQGSANESGANTGKLVHQGWQAGKIELADWTGDPADADIIAPAQLQQ